MGECLTSRAEFAEFIVGHIRVPLDAVPLSHPGLVTSRHFANSAPPPIAAQNLYKLYKFCVVYFLNLRIR